MNTDFAKRMAKAGLEISTAAEAAQARGWLSTGNYALNWAVSGRFQGGWALGHVAEIYGDSSTGKSYIANSAIAQAQAAGYATLLDDTEGAFQNDWARRIGITPEQLVYTRSDTVKEHYEIVNNFTDAIAASRVPDQKGLLILDSLALLTTEHEQEKGLDTVSLMRAKEIRTLFRVQGRRVNNADIVYLVANHTIANIGNVFQQNTTPGGGGLKFQSSVRLEMRATKKLKDAHKQVIGVYAHAHTAKNRLSPPFKSVHLIIPYYGPISPCSGLIPALLDLQIIGEAGKIPSVVYRGEDTGLKVHKSNVFKQDESAAALLVKHPDILQVADDYLAELEASQLGEAEEEDV